VNDETNAAIVRAIAAVRRNFPRDDDVTLVALVAERFVELNVTGDVTGNGDVTRNVTGDVTPCPECAARKRKGAERTKRWRAAERAAAGHFKKGNGSTWVPRRNGELLP
jgi:hypothetical protein